MSLFLDEKTKEAKSKDYLLATIGNKDLTTPAQNTMTDYLAGWNECEKHVRESVSDAADLRSCMCSRFIVEIEQLKAENERLKLALAGKTGSCILCEDAQKEIERLRLHDIPGYQEGVEELKAHIKNLERVGRLVNLDYCPECGNGDYREPEEKGHRQCNDRECLQEWFTDVDYFSAHKPALRNRKDKIQSLEAQIKERDEALIDFNHALNYSISQLGGCECDQSVGFTCGTCCVDRDYQKHQSLINQIKERRKCKSED